MSNKTILLQFALAVTVVFNLFLAGLAAAADGINPQDQQTTQSPVPKSDPYFRVALLPKLPAKKAEIAEPATKIAPLTIENTDRPTTPPMVRSPKTGETPIKPPSSPNDFNLQEKPGQTQNLAMPTPNPLGHLSRKTAPAKPPATQGQTSLPTQFNPGGVPETPFDSPPNNVAPPQNSANLTEQKFPAQKFPAQKFEATNPAFQQPAAEKKGVKPDTSIKLNSVASDANLLEPKPIPKISLKPNQERFEAGRTLARVGGEPIFAADLMFEVNQLVERFMAGAPEDVKREQRQLIIPRLLNKYIESKLLYVDIVRGLPDQANVADINESLGDHFDGEVLPLILKKNKVKSTSEFDTQLRGQGISFRQFRKRWIEDEFVKYFLKEKIALDPLVTHQEMIEYYREHAADFEVEARAKWEQLVVSFARIADRQKAKLEIAKMGNEYVYGAPLAAVAKRSSHGFRASDGGMQGWVTKGSLVSKKLDDAIFDIPLKRLSDIIETGTGYHIIRVLERTRAGRTPFLKAQVEIAKKIKESKRETNLKEYIAKLKRVIPVETFLDKSELKLVDDGKPSRK